MTPLRSTPEERAEIRRMALAVSAAREALERGDDPAAAVAFDNASAALHAKLSPNLVVNIIDSHELDLEELTFLREQATRVYRHLTGSDDPRLYAHQVIQRSERRIQDRVADACEEVRRAAREGPP